MALEKIIKKQKNISKSKQNNTNMIWVAIIASLVVGGVIGYVMNNTRNVVIESVSGEAIAKPRLIPIPRPPQPQPRPPQPQPKQTTSHGGGSSIDEVRYVCVLPGQTYNWFISWRNIINKMNVGQQKIFNIYTRSNHYRLYLYKANSTQECSVWYNSK